MEFEDILKQVGGFGKFQRNLTIFFTVPLYCIMSWLIFNKIFMLSTPQHWCNVPELKFANLSIEEQRIIISPPSDPSCSMYDLNYTEMLFSGIFKVPNETHIIPCVSGWNYDTEYYDETATTKWDLVCKYDYLPSLIFTLYNVGVLVGTPIYGILSDKFGRKIMFLFVVGLVFVTEAASVFTSNLMVFAILRLINGTAFPTVFTLSYILVLEIVSPQMRAHLNGIINTCWTLGFCFLPLVAYLSRSWKNLCLISAGLGLFFLGYFRFIPESPSWLVSQGRVEEATDIMMKIAKTNGKPQNRMDIFQQLQKLMEKGKRKKEDEISSKSLILRYPRLRRNFLVITFCWVCFTVTYSGLTFNMVNLSGNEFINFFLMCVVEFPGNFFSWYAMDRFGRRWVASIGFFLAGLGCLLPVIGFDKSDIISSMIGKLIVAGVVMITDQQAVELFPTESRSFGFGAGKTVSAALTMFVPFIAYLNIYGKAVPFIIISTSCIFASFLASLLPESLDENLPQTILDADVFGKDQKFFSFNRKSTTVQPRKITISIIEPPH